MSNKQAFLQPPIEVVESCLHLVENCPYCNEPKKAEKVSLKGLTCWQVRCYNCHIKGEIAKEKDIAIQAWNEKVRLLR